MPTIQKQYAQVKSISLPPPLAKTLDKFVRRTKQSRSKVLQEALEGYLLLAELEELQSYGVQRAIALGLEPEDVGRLIDEYRREKKNSSRR